MRTTLIGLLLGATLALGCDDRATSTSTTAAAADSGTSATEDLKQGGRDLGAAAQKAAEEAKKEVKSLDVKVTTGDAGHP
ncbi:MAG: hypothetical protein JWP97_2848 [Labilithrix sp.]|nr:hypothetical protein [Labilithrix sp.]